MTNKLKKITKGFTLIEMLVAVLLLITAIAGPLTIASKGITASIVAKDQVTAFNLAQDAVEYIRFRRDTNKLAGNPWLTGLEGCLDIKGCHLDSTENDPVLPVTCPTEGCVTRALRYDITNHRYTHANQSTANCNAASGVCTTIFRRIVFITTPVNGNADEAAVTVQMLWSDQANITREIVVRENMLDWQ